jgi:hypothetical protein
MTSGRQTSARITAVRAQAYTVPTDREFIRGSAPHASAGARNSGYYRHAFTSLKRKLDG